MATRLYFSGYTPPVSPGFYAEWDRTAIATRRTLRLNKVSNTNAEVGGAETSATSPYDVILRQFVSEPIQAQTISGTVKGQIRARESDPAAQMGAALVIRVVSNDGLTERGVLLAYFPAALSSGFDPATSTNRKFPPSTALTSVTCQDGDRIVVEIGHRAFNTVTTSYTGYVWFNNTMGTADLPEDETTTDNLCPWIEFSQALLWDQVQVNQAVTQVEYQLPGLLQANQLIAQVEYGIASGDIVQQLIAQVEYDHTRLGYGAASLPALTATGAGIVSVPLTPCRSCTTCCAIPLVPDSCRSQSRCVAIPLVPGFCRSPSSCPGLVVPAPSSCRSCSACGAVPLVPDQCRSTSRCQAIPALGPASCQSLTICPGCSGGNPSHAGSLTKLQDIPLARGEGTFLVF